MKNDLTVVVLAAGKGTRMQSESPKVLHKVGGFSLIDHVLATLKGLKPKLTYVITGYGAAAVEASVQPIPCIRQQPQLGTGHAVQVALKKIGKVAGDLLIVYGDSPFLSAQTLKTLIDTHRAKANAVTVLGFHPNDPDRYGRLIMNGEKLTKIVEYSNATDKEKQIDFCNSGVVMMKGDVAAKLIAGLSNKNNQKEYLLTDVVEAANAQGLICGVSEASEQELLGINDRFQLAQAEAFFQDTKRREFLNDGVTLIDPATVYFAADTKIASDVVIEPDVFFGPGVSIESGVVIKSFSHIEGAKIKKNAKVGPFARIRSETEIGEGAKVGNFVEVKKSKIKKGAKVSHLSYVGDADVGENANIGAGTITCNYDGKNKHKTVIGNGAFVGSNTALIAPVKIGNKSFVAAGSVISKNLKDGEMGITRAEQKNFKNSADYRKSKSKK